jgi:hypothetical protein
LASKASPEAADASPMLAPLLGARAESLIPITDDGSMRYDVDLPESSWFLMHNFPSASVHSTKGESWT